MIDWLNEHGKQHTWVVQKYLERPLLVHQRKFDMRLYALIRYPFDVFFYRDGTFLSLSLSLKSVVSVWFGEFTTTATRPQQRGSSLSPVSGRIFAHLL